MQETTIRLSEPSDRRTLIKLVNEVYEKCEGHLWKEGHCRLTDERFHGYYNNKQLLVAARGDVIVGCVVMSRVSDDANDVSMLVVHPDFRRQGIGRKLVDYVIDSARTDGCRCVQVELLYPTHEEDLWKKTLRKWYTSLGFEFVINDDFIKYYPGYKDSLVMETTFSIFEKPLKY